MYYRKYGRGRIRRSGSHAVTHQRMKRPLVLVLGPLVSVSTPSKMAPMIEIYKNTIVEAEPIGRFVNDNVLLVTLAVCLEDGNRARQVMATSDALQVRALASRYHDTFHRELAAPPSPEGDMTEDQLNAGISNGTLICGDPDEVLAQLQAFVNVGCDQIGFFLAADRPSHGRCEGNSPANWEAYNPEARP